MKKSVVKVLSCVLAVVLVLSAAPLSGFTGIVSYLTVLAGAEEHNNFFWCQKEENGETFAVINGYNYDEGDGFPSELVFPDEIDGLTVKWIESDAFSGKSELTRVVLPAGLTILRDGVFCDDVNLAEINIPDTLVEIGSSAFENCEKLFVGGTLSIPASVERINNRAFANTGIAQLVVTRADGLCLELFDEAFTGCQSLTSVAIQGYADEPADSVRVNGRVFADCTALTSVSADCYVVLGFEAFYGCSSLDTVSVNNNVTVCDRSFCETSVSTLTIGRDVTICNEAFARCMDLKSLSVEVEGRVEFNDNAFVQSGLETVSITRSEDDTDDIWMNIGNSAFEECGSLGSVHIEHNVNINNNAFKACSSLDSVTLSDNVRVNCDAFKNSGIKQLSTFNGVEIYDNAFVECSKLATISCTGDVSIGCSAFRECTSLKTFTVESCSESEINDGAFEGCNALETVTLENTRLYGRAFRDCSVQSVTMRECDCDNYAFEGMSSITEVHLINTEIREGMFRNCDNLEIIETDAVNFGREAFHYTKWYNDSYPGILTINNSVYTYKHGVDEETGDELPPVNGVVAIPDGTLHLLRGSLDDAWGMETLEIPASVEWIDDDFTGVIDGFTTIVVDADNENYFSHTGLLYANMHADFGDYLRLSHVPSSAGRNTDGVVEIYSGLGWATGEAFLNRHEIKTFTVSEGESCYYVDDDILYCDWDEDGLSLIVCPHQKEFEGDVYITDGVNRISPAAFADIASLGNPETPVAVHLPASLYEIDPFAFAADVIDEYVVADANETFCTVDGVLYTKDDENKELVLYPVGNGLTSFAIPTGVRVIGETAFAFAYDLTEVIFPAKLTEIRDNAFIMADALKSVEINEDDGTSLRIGYQAFCECHGLTAVKLAGDITVGSGAFAAAFDKDSNATISLQRGVTLESDAFSYLYYDEYDEENDINTRYYSIASVFAAEGVIIGENAFRMSVGGTVDIKNSVSVDRQAFSDCKITALSVYDEAPDYVEDYQPCVIGDEAFANNGEQIDMPGESYFAGSIKYIGITGPCNIGWAAFRNSAAGVVYLTSAGTSTLTVSDEAFAESKLLEEIVIQGAVNVGNRSFNNCNALKKVIASGSDEDGTQVVLIGNEAFNGCQGIKEVTLQNNIEVSDCAFRDCRIQKVTIADENGDYRTEIHSSAFENNCENTEDGFFPSIETLNVYGNVRIEGNAFNRSLCGEITLNGLGEENAVTVEGNAFNECFPDTLTIGDYVSLQNRVFGGGDVGPQKITAIGNSILHGGAFEDCDRLTRVVLGNGVCVYSGAFRECDVLSELIMFNGVQLSDGVFENCRSLTQLSLPEDMEQTFNNAFRNCPIETVYIPAALTVAGDGSFIWEDEEGAHTYANRYYGGTEDEWKEIEDCGNNRSLFGEFDMGPYWDVLNRARDRFNDACNTMDSARNALNDDWDDFNTRINNFNQRIDDAKNDPLQDALNILSEMSEFEEISSKVSDVIGAFEDALSITTEGEDGIQQRNDALDEIGGLIGEVWEAINSACNVDNSTFRLMPDTAEHTHSHAEDAKYIVLSEQDCENCGYREYTCDVCGLKYAESTGTPAGHIYESAPTCVSEYECILCHKLSGLDPENHEGDTQIRDAVAATCTETGYTGDTYCGSCDALLSEGEETEALGHSFTEYVSDENATCLTDGTKTAVCDRDGCDATDTVTEEGTILEHSFTGIAKSNNNGTHSYKCVNGCDDYGATEECAYKSFVSPASCTQKGETLYKCNVCSYTYTEEIPVNSHEWDEGTVLIEATCTAVGIMQYTCNLCKTTSTKDIEINPDNHTGLVEDKGYKATCTEDGLTDGSHCTACGKTVVAQEVIEAPGHDYKQEVTRPTCTTGGYTVNTCTVCYDTYISNTVEAAGHTVVSVVAVEAGCTETGLTEGKCCSVCNTILVAQKIVAATGHTYKAESIADRQHKFTCEKCGDTYTEKCSYEVMGKVTATCTKKGETDYRCTVCAHIYAEYTEMLPHTVVADAATEATCTTDGKTAGSHCSVCKTVITAQDTIPAKGHNVAVDKAVDATCTEDGKTEGKHCTVCNAVLVEQKTIPAKGHTVAVDKAVEATCTEAGTTEGKHCTVCNTIIEKQETIPAKGHTVVVDKAVAATETSTGLTEGSHCSVCNTVIVAQQVIDKLAPSVINTENTTEVNGILYAAPGTPVSEIGEFATAEGDTLKTGMTVTKKNGEKLTVAIVGDVDGDGAVTVADARLCLRRAIGLENYEPVSAQGIACNVSPADKIDVGDARMILRAAIGLENPSDWRTTAVSYAVSE